MERSNRSQDWRDLCAAAANEQDGAKLTSLVNQIVEALDNTILPRHFSQMATTGDCLDR